MEPERPPRPTRIQIDVRLSLPRRLGWLLAGVSIGTVHLPDLVVQVARLILHATGHG